MAMIIRFDEALYHCRLYPGTDRYTGTGTKNPVRRCNPLMVPVLLPAVVPLVPVRGQLPNGTKCVGGTISRAGGAAGHVPASSNRPT
eukprot:100181-Rhodomonas_salina.1